MGTNTQPPAGRRPIDEPAVRTARGAVADRGAVQAMAARYALLADPGRLALLLAIRRAGPICVTDLALATGIRDTTVSQALRLLRATGTVSAARHGRTVRYQLDDPAVARLLDRAADA
ncbi:ArsR/SmtB family transcription factor [Kitasatospora sp. NPDC087861]|uniref:ArsR/SmtB family transcription factor n=1 Tax=unclassified Kitasatospora TaxID=2633591 RepID=UPI002473A54C|nr:metalloregulator ArsR/SmtB family transcription factor [Kitasatospora sp. MAA19]